MSVDIYITHEDTLTSRITQEEMLRIATSALIKLRSMHLDNETAGPNDTVTYCGRHIGFVTRGIVQLITNVRNAVDVLDEFNGQLQRLADRQEHFIKYVCDHADIPCMHNYIVNDINNSHISISTVYKGQKCESCGEIIPANKIDAHKASLRCAYGTAIRDVHDNGWLEVQDPIVISALKKANIEKALRPTGFSFWIPPWAHEAIEMYRQNNGFAGLTLDEYLGKFVSEGVNGNTK